MKRHILFGLALLLAFPVCVSAQDEYDEENVEVAVRKVKKIVAQKRYETRTIKGRVLNGTTKEPISGAIVSAAGVKGYSALTDDNGYYEVKVPTFSSAVNVKAPDFNLVVAGLEKSSEMKDIYVLPTKFTKDYEEDVNILLNQKADNFKYSNALNIKEEMQKQLGAYAYSTQRSGTPGIGSVTFMQGLNSLNANAQPLVVVDGVIMDQQYSRTMMHDGFYNDVLSNINPSDIEEITVMRNGTALYGARGANGVINISTSRSHSMATRITASISAGISSKPKFYSMMDAEQYRSYASELLKGTGTDITNFKFLNTDPNYYYYKQYHCNTNWKDYIYQTAVTQNYGIKVEGGDDVASYNLSVGYVMAESTLKFNDMSRLNIRFNTDIQLTEKLGVRFDASFSNLTRDLRDDAAPTTYSEGTPSSPSFLAYAKAPFLSPYAYGQGKFSTSYYDTTDETYLDEALVAFPRYNYQLGNPVAFNEYAEAENKNRFENSLLNIAVTPKWKFNKHLELSSHFAYTLINSSNKYYIPVNGVPTYYVNSVTAYRDNEVSSLASKQNSIQSDTRLAWDNRYDAHKISVFGGVRLNFETYSTSKQLGYDTGSDKTPFMSAGLKNAQSSGVDEEWRNMDIYVQGNYNYLGRYFAQVNLTASGSSRFGTDAAGGARLFGTKFGIFPAFQGSWVVSNEPWFSKKFVNHLSLTAGYDISGNDDINVNARKSFFASNLYLNDVAGLTFSGIGNTKIKWETTRRFNVGVQTSMLNNRLFMALNYFNSTTIDLLQLQQLSFLSGLTTNWGNNGKLKNQGVDFTMKVKAITTKDWSFEVGASFGHYKNRIVDLGLADGKDYITTKVASATIITKEGSAANLFYGYKTRGVYATTEQAQKDGFYMMADNGVDKNFFQAGDVIFRDINGDKEINEKDMTVIGDPNPDLYGNIMASLGWKRLRLDVNFNYCVGNDVFNYMRSQLEAGSRFQNQTTALTQRWMAEGQVTNVPRISFQDNMGNSRFSDRWIEDGSYLKLKSVTLSYDLPINITFLQGLEFWLQGNNLFTVTRYLGSDPEFSATSNVIGQGIDFGSVGSSRSIVAGVKIKL
ncbi:MAG: SusC/RagA family TonB-linked outer membrane protein [Prevotella sp.]|nr:SusC/RagA family TonB-linked outer membrane protein [Candidatus Prevotella equi]